MTDLPSSAPAGSPPLDKRISEIRERLAAATPRPWKRDRNWLITGPGNDWDKHWGKPGVTLANYDRSKTVIVCHVHGPGEANHAVEDGYLISHAPDDLEYVLAQLAALQEENERLRGQPFGFTQDDVALLELFADVTDVASASFPGDLLIASPPWWPKNVPETGPARANAFRSLAARIASLLRPEAPSLSR